MTLQNHIHMSLVLGGAPENAPDKLWRITSHVLTPLVSINVEYTRKFGLREQVYKSAGVPVILFGYTVKLLIFNEDPDDTADQLDDLIAMIGRRVYYVDIKHPNDGADHTSAVQSLLFGKIEGLEAGESRLRLYEPTITLHPVGS
ncbi:MAG: hypothetical protein E6R03_07180 [Hyphomicrobiaceae bacterium]|nr:MAG: hypothetical protein E6R03_07180 [Hyphomicrobiaceae bacterium]